MSGRDRRPHDRRDLIALATERLRLGMVQMTSGEDVDANLRACERLIEDGARAGAELTVFPENTLHLRVTPGAAIRAPTPADLARLGRAVDRAGVPALVTTALGVGPKFRNATVLIEPGRPARVVYEKMHLFDVDVPGAPPVRESAAFTAGDGPALIDVAGWRLGLSICYDLRFAGLYLNYAGTADLILVPAAFLVPTGRAHWHVLLRARAIEGQCFVVAPAQVGPHRAGDHARETYGHALAVDPWGEILVDLDVTPGLAVVSLEREVLRRTRAQIPMADHRRPC